MALLALVGSDSVEMDLTVHKRDHDAGATVTGPYHPAMWYMADVGWISLKCTISGLEV